MVHTFKFPLIIRRLTAAFDNIRIGVLKQILFQFDLLVDAAATTRIKNPVQRETSDSIGSANPFVVVFFILLLSSLYCSISARKRFSFYDRINILIEVIQKPHLFELVNGMRGISRSSISPHHPEISRYARCASPLKKRAKADTCTLILA